MVHERAQPPTRRVVLDYALAPIGRGIRCRPHHDGLTIILPVHADRAVNRAMGWLGSVPDIGCVVLALIPILALVVVYWAFTGRFSVRQHGWLVGVWLALVGLLAALSTLAMRGRTEIEIRGRKLTVRVPGTDLCWQANVADVSGVNAIGGRLHIWLGGLDLLANADDERLYWHGGMPEEELRWLVDTLRAALGLDEGLISSQSAR